MLLRKSEVCFVFLELKLFGIEKGFCVLLFKGMTNTFKEIGLGLYFYRLEKEFYVLLMILVNSWFLLKSSGILRPLNPDTCRLTPYK